jgi:hypothetical protein
LANGLQETSRVVVAPKFVSESERREELVRLYLAQLGLRPQGETLAQDENRLATPSSIGRQKVIQAAAELAAAKYIRE